MKRRAQRDRVPRLHLYELVIGAFEILVGAIVTLAI